MWASYMNFILGVLVIVDSCPSSPDETAANHITSPSNPTPAPPTTSPVTPGPPTPSPATPGPPTPSPVTPTPPSTSSARYMMITTGEEKGKGKSTEVFDMKDPTKTCKNLPEYPLDVFMAAGGLIDKMPVICGGNSNDPSAKIKTCYILKNNIEWTKLSSLVFSRFIENVNPGSVIVNDGKSLWITGGATLDTDPSQPDISKSSEYVFPDGSVVKGPDLIVKGSDRQVAFYNHCMVELKNGSVMVMGVKFGSNQGQKTFLFNSNTKELIQFHDMLKERYNAGCALFNSPKHGDRSVVAIGGGEYGKSTIEILDYTKDGSTWEIIINDFGFQGSMGIMMLSTPDKKGLYVISKNGIFELSFNTTSFTLKKTSVDAKVSRPNWPIAMYVGEEYANCS